MTPTARAAMVAGNLRLGRFFDRYPGIVEVVEDVLRQVVNHCARGGYDPAQASVEHHIGAAGDLRTVIRTGAHGFRAFANEYAGDHIREALFIEANPRFALDLTAVVVNRYRGRIEDLERLDPCSFTTPGGTIVTTLIYEAPALEEMPLTVEILQELPPWVDAKTAAAYVMQRKRELVAA